MVVFLPSAHAAFGSGSTAKPPGPPAFALPAAAAPPDAPGLSPKFTWRPEQAATTAAASASATAKASGGTERSFIGYLTSAAPPAFDRGSPEKTCMENGRALLT